MVECNGWSLWSVTLRIDMRSSTKASSAWPPWKKNTIFLQLPTSNIKTYCWHELFPPSVDHSGQPARQPAQRNRPCGTFQKNAQPGSLLLLLVFFLFLRGTFERSLQVSWCCLNCSSPGAHSSPIGRPGLPTLFFILARKMEMFGKQPVRWFQCWKTRGWCWRSSSWSLGAEGECRPSLGLEKVNTDNVGGKGRGVLD